MNIRIRPFDIVEINDANMILGQRGGYSHHGRWSVVSNNEDFLVLSRGGRILRVKPEGVIVVGHFTTDVKIDTGIEGIDDVEE